MIVQQFNDEFGYIRTLWQFETTGWEGTAQFYKHKNIPTISDLQALETAYIEEQQYDTSPRILYTLEKHKVLIKEIIDGIKANPSMTLTAFNNYVSSKAWWEQAIVNFFMVVTAEALADQYNINLSDYGNSTIFTNVRDWIVAKDIKEITKVILY